VTPSGKRSTVPTLLRRFSKENLDHGMQPPVSTPESGSDWHPADMLAALKRHGRTLAGFSIAHGNHSTAAGKALRTLARGRSDHRPGDRRVAGRHLAQSLHRERRADQPNAEMIACGAWHRPSALIRQWSRRSGGGTWREPPLIRWSRAGTLGFASLKHAHFHLVASANLQMDRCLLSGRGHPAPCRAAPPG